ncbi:trypsin-like serine protease [Myxococcota bacterium]|nr:trypsin-like serine protease [Myxococcota bacterium]
MTFVLTACGPAVEPSLVDAERLGDPRVTALVRDGHVELELGEGKDDPSVVADATELLTGALDGVAPLDFDAGHHISLRYLGKGRRGPMAAGADAEARAIEPTGEELDGVDAFNLATGNEFRIVLSGGLLEAIGRHDHAHGLDRGTDVAEDEAVEVRPPLLAPSDAPPGQNILFSWSNDDDDRYRLYGFNAAVTVDAHQRLVQLGSGCSGTLVGPRHVVTAGHCLYSRKNGTWADDFWVRAGANGTSFVTRVFVNANAIPAGQVVWYYTPSQYRAASGSTWGYDYGILTIPARLGDTVGWMGRVSYTFGSLTNADIYRRGYPACSATTDDGTPRTDVPDPCDPNHIYANASFCDVGELESLDADNWSRVLHHSCDASGGDSGSALYVYHDGVPSVTAVHFASRCKTTADDDECTGTQIDRPLAAIRLTPQYRDLIGYFRSTYP